MLSVPPNFYDPYEDRAIKNRSVPDYAGRRMNDLLVPTREQVLVVDDDRRITRVVQRIAAKVGLRVREINDSTKLNQVLSSSPATLIVLDLNMPGKDGIEIINDLADRNSRAELLFVSGADRRVLGTAEKLATGRNLGVAGSLQKPMDIADLREVLAKHARKFGLPALSDLDEALQNDHLQVAYQPKFDVATGEVVGVEALARWDHPVLGAVDPEIFVTMAENSGRIAALTKQVAGVALGDVREWHAAGSDLSVSINLSPQLLTNPAIPDQLATAIADQGIPAGRVIFEVTERGAMSDVNQSMAVLTRLCIKGVQISIDDFGTGSSSLVQLYRMPFGEIKIDKSFIFAMLRDREASVIVKSTIQLGHNMGLRIVAEGVEDCETLAELREMGCDQAQGFFFSRPLMKPEFAAWLDDNAGVRAIA